MEFQIIQKYFSIDSFPIVNHQLVLAGGDDCALLNVDSRHSLAVSVDTLNEGVHFPQGCPAEWVAARALRSNLSDLAACGAKPVAFTLALSLPQELVQNDQSWLERFSQQLAADSRQFGIDLMGGDTTRGPLSITIQAIGQVPDGQAMLRSGARVGDDVYVTGTLGGAAAWLQDKHQAEFISRYAYPEPRNEFAIGLKLLATSCLDISDGLLADLQHICKASHVSAEVEVSNIPLSKTLRIRSDALELALSGGDDYELCFTCPPSKADKVLALAKEQGLEITRIGRIVDSQTEIIKLTQNGESYSLSQKGYEHFS